MVIYYYVVMKQKTRIKASGNGKLSKGCGEIMEGDIAAPYILAVA